jgi:lysophospholipase L1-like esterase
MPKRRKVMMRGFLAGFLVVPVLVGTVFAASPAAASKLDAIAIGDSVMLGAQSQLRELGIRSVDAEVSRQATSGPRLLRQRGAKLPAHVVVHLGTNGTFTAKTCRQIVRAAGRARTVYLINVKVPRQWERSNNRIIRACAEGFRSDRVVVLDWNARASKNPNFLYADGVHLRPEGARAFARMVHEAVTTPRAPYTDRLPRPQ